MRTYEKNAVCDGYTSSVTCRRATCDSFSSRRSLPMRHYRLPNSHFSFTEESILKFIPLKVRNLVSLPLEGKETAAGCRMRCSRRRRRFFRMFAPHIPYASSLRRRQSRRISLRDTPKSNPIEMSGANAMRARSVATQGSRNESDLSCQRNVTFL